MAVLAGAYGSVAREGGVAGIALQLGPGGRCRPGEAAVARADEGALVGSARAVTARDEERSVGELDDLSLVTIATYDGGAMPALALVVGVDEHVVHLPAPVGAHAHSGDEHDAALAGDDPIARAEEAAIGEAVGVDLAGDLTHGLPAAAAVRALGGVHL